MRSIPTRLFGCLVAGALLSLLACSTDPRPSPTQSVELTADDTRLTPPLPPKTQIRTSGV
jgi:hypothetical protein